MASAFLWLDERFLSRAAYRGLEDPLPAGPLAELVFCSAEEGLNGPQDLRTGCAATGQEAAHGFTMDSEVCETGNLLPDTSRPLP